MQNGFRLLMLTCPYKEDEPWYNVIDESDDIEELVDIVTSRTILMNHLGYDVSIPEDESEGFKISDSRTGKVAGYLLCGVL